MSREIIFIVGPTASGKTEAAVSLAKKIKAEIISMDSMQIYKGMRILTSWPRREFLRSVKHYLVGGLPNSKEHNVSQYRKDSLKIVDKIFSRGKTPIFVGGSGLYFSILLEGIFEGSRSDQKLRIRLERLAKKYGKNYLYKRLIKADPEAASRIHPNDTRRVIRALEVFLTKGERITKLHNERIGLRSDYKIKAFCLNIERSKLYDRINERVEKMLKEGLLIEVKRLLKHKLSKTAACAIGIRELEDYFNSRISLAEAKELIKRNTRRYAKRQLTWFRKSKDLKWINLRGTEKASQVSNLIWKELS
jgi:tRNA dimethylallyltransferase